MASVPPVQSGGLREAELRSAWGLRSFDKCAQAVDDWSYQLKSVGPASGGRAGSITWTAPTGTAIRSFYLDHDSRTADKHYAEIHVLDGNGGDTNIYRAPNAPGGFVRYWRTGLLHRAVRVLLFCSDSGGCVRSDAAHSFVRNVELELADVANPSFYSVSGSLIDGGWKRGTHDFAAQTGDVGSGVRRLDVVVNGSRSGSGQESTAAGRRLRIRPTRDRAAVRRSTSMRAPLSALSATE